MANARFAKHLDSELILELAVRTRRLVIVEENALAGDFGSAVLEFLKSINSVQVKVDCIGLPDASGSPSRSFLRQH